MYTDKITAINDMKQCLILINIMIKKLKSNSTVKKAVSEVYTSNMTFPNN